MSIIKSRVPFAETFIPPSIADREIVKHLIQSHLAPLTRGDIQPVGLHVVGGIGTGKTVTIKVLLENLNIPYVYINLNSLAKAKAYHAIAQILQKLGGNPYGSLTRLEQIVKKMLSGKAFVIVLDEADACPIKELDHLIHFLTRETTVTVILISRKPELIQEFAPDTQDSFKYRECLFEEYTQQELLEILKQRSKLALFSSAYTKEILKEIAKEAEKIGSARYAIDLLAEAASLAEYYQAEKITKKHVQEAIERVRKNFFETLVAVLPKTHKAVLQCLFNAEQKNIPLSVTALFECVKRTLEKNKLGPITRRQFERILQSLKERNLIFIKKVGLGRGRGFRVYVHLTDYLMLT